MGIFLDTGFYLGLIHKKDQHYARSQQILIDIRSGIYGQLYTSPFIMAEAASLVAIRTHKNPSALQKIQELFTGDLTFATSLKITELILTKTWKFFIDMNVSEKSKDKRKFLSFVDCSNIIFCQEHQIENILAFDGDFYGWLNVIH